MNPTPTGQPRGTRIVGIDSLRGIAAVLVMLFHYTTRYDERYIHTGPLPFAVPWGHLGVNLFFMISGFVIFMTLARTQRPADFIISRASRLYPAYWAAVLITWGAEAVLHAPTSAPSWGEALANFLMFHSLFGVPHVDGVYWTLEVELLFYLAMFGLWLIGALRRPLPVIVAWLALAWVAAFSQRLVGVEVPYVVVRFLNLRYFTYFAIGIALYHAHRRGRTLGLPEFAVIAFALVTIGAVESMTRAIWAIGFTALLAIAVSGHARLLSSRLLVWLGAISYPLYLLHEGLGWGALLLLEPAGVPPMVAVMIAIAMSLALADALHRLVEQPAMRFVRERYRAYVRKRAMSPADTRRLRWIVGVVAAAVLLVAGNRIALALAQQRAATPAGPLPTQQATRGEAVPCVEPGRAALVLLVIGQSNAANHAQLDANPNRVRVFTADGCRKVGDPLPGGTGDGTSLWTALDATLRERSRVEPVFAVHAVDATSIAQWTSAGPLRDGLDALVARMRGAGLNIDAVLWQQGEADAMRGTTAEDYIAGLRGLIDRLRERGVEAPVFIARSTYCRGDGHGVIARTVAQVPEAIPRTSPGANTDTIRGAGRYDGCHFSTQGRAQAATLWFDALRPAIEAVEQRAPATR